MEDKIEKIWQYAKKGIKISLMITHKYARKGIFYIHTISVLYKHKNNLHKSFILHFLHCL